MKTTKLTLLLACLIALPALAEDAAIERLVTEPKP